MTGVRDDLRALTQRLVLDQVESCTHDTLPATCRRLGLPEPPGKTRDDDEAATLSKRERLQRAFDQLDPRRYPDVLSRFLDHGQLSPQQRNDVEDLLWAREPWPVINRRTRREIVEALEHVPPVWKDADGFRNLLSRLWVLETEVGLWTGHTLASDIERHVFQNPDDWPLLELFTRLGALNSSNHRFALFIQGLLSGAVTPDEDHQRAMAVALIPPLSRANLKIIETAVTDGYPGFAIVPTGAAARPPQLILFASMSKKPDLRLREVLDQQVELVNDPGEVLRYDRPIPESGLTWDQLQAWWADRENLSPDDAKRSL
jgi:AbiJ-like protein